MNGEIVELWTLLALGLSVIAAYVIYRVLKALWPLVYNGIFGLGTFWLLNYLGIINTPINIWTFLITAIGGLFGVLVVVVLTYFGVRIG